MKTYLFNSFFFFLFLSIELEAQLKFDKLVNRYNKLDEKSVVFRNLSLKKQGKLINEAAKLRSDTKKHMNADNQGTGLVSCFNECQTEYDLCCQDNSDFLCNLQAIKCLYNCSKSSGLKTQAIKNNHEQLLKKKL